jgi:hypothetical protein
MRYTPNCLDARCLPAVHHQLRKAHLTSQAVQLLSLVLFRVIRQVFVVHTPADIDNK